MHTEGLKIPVAESIAAGRVAAKSSRYAWYMIGILLVAYTFSFIDRQILSLLVEPMKRDLGISDTQVSLLQGLSFALFYTILGLPMGRLADTVSRRGLIATGLTLWSLATAVCGLAGQYWQLFVARMGVGVGEASLSPAAYSLIADSVDRKNLAAAIGVYSMGIYIGGGLALIAGGAVVAWAVNIDSVVVPLIGEIRSWQLVFLAVGLPGLLLVPFVLTLREPRRANAGGTAIPLADVWQFLRHNRRTLILLILGAALASLAGYGSVAWVPSFLIRTHQLGFAEAGLAFGLIVLIFGSAGVVSGGRIADWLGQRGRQDGKPRTALYAALLGLAPTLLYPLMPSLTGVLILLSISTYFTNFMMGLGPAAIQEVVPANMRGQISALYLFVVNIIGLGLGPLSIALATDYVFEDPNLLRYSLVLAPGCALTISALLLWRALPHYRASLASHETSQAH
ncbi:MFS transporter [uncultured Microbulbifer sp.]|uniref:spinster family MFS transporter n=1 Tax=uncultured Microbulbifer sp. TaxID=348147 RepID=UPI0026169682|nr:MFS transporter [uncultured Microbulbifer sp.]